jgi:hypothetical protein
VKAKVGILNELCNKMTEKIKKSVQNAPIFLFYGSISLSGSVGVTFAA